MKEEKAFTKERATSCQLALTVKRISILLRFLLLLSFKETVHPKKEKNTHTDFSYSAFINIWKHCIFFYTELIDVTHESD